MALPPFLIDASGMFDESQLRLEWRDEPRPAHPELDALVERTWQKQMDQSRRLGIHLFNGRLVRYLRHEQYGGSLVIEAGPTDYAQFMGTNYLHHHRGDELGWDLFSNPIGTSATVITADGWLPMGRRNDRVACHAGFVHNFGGSLELNDRRADGTMDAFGSMGRELSEEAGIGPGDIREIICLGLIRDPYVRQPELIFDATVALSRDQIAARIHTTDAEHTGIVACPDAADAIETFIRKTSMIAPITVGALCLHGRRAFGEQWFEQALRRLPAPLAPF